MARLQVLEIDAMPPIGGREVGLVLQPPRVRRHPVLRREDQARELARGDAHAFLREPRPERVHRTEARDEQLGAGERRLHLVDTWIGVVRRGLGWGQRLVDLPRERHPGRAVLRQQVVEHRRAGAGLAHDHDRWHHVARGDVRMLGAVAQDSGTRREVARELAGCDLHTQLVELRFAPQRLDETLEAIAPGGRPELVAARGRGRGRDDRVGVEGQLRHRAEVATGIASLSRRRYTDDPARPTMTVRVPGRMRETGRRERRS